MRVDFAYPEWVETAQNPYNPPLAPVGLTQGRETALRLKDEQIDAVFVSPFLRTLQTAHLIAEKKSLPLYVEPGFSEFLKKGEFPHMPDVYDPDVWKKEFPLINYDYTPASSSKYPETHHHLDLRIDQTMAKLLDSSYTHLLIVSHGSPIKSLYRYFNVHEPVDYQPMCSVSRFDLEDGKWNMAVDGDSSHLSVADTTGKAFYADLEKNRTP